MELTIAMKWWQSFCFSLPSARIIGITHQTRFIVMFLQIFIFNRFSGSWSSFVFEITYFYIYIFSVDGVWVWVHMCHDTYLELRGQLLRVCSVSTLILRKGLLFLSLLSLLPIWLWVQLLQTWTTASGFLKFFPWVSGIEFRSSGLYTGTFICWTSLALISLLIFWVSLHSHHACTTIYH